MKGRGRRIGTHRALGVLHMEIFVLTTSRFKDSRKTLTPTETQKSEYIWNQSVYRENIDH
jgi:hypothetical protein